MTFVSLALIITILAIVALKMTGQGEAVDAVSSKVVNKLGLIDPKQSKKDFAKEVLGWDITDIKNKPVATVKAGKVRLEKVIDELEQLRLKHKITTTEAEFKKSESDEEMKNLLDSIHVAKAYLQDPNSTYPANIQSFTYSNREQLETATARAIRRFETLKRSSTLKDNTPVYGNQLSATIAKRLDQAYQMLELLNARLMFAEMQENKLAFSEIDKELSKLTAVALTIVNDGEDAVTDLPAGFTSERERDKNTIDSFNY